MNYTVNELLELLYVLESEVDVLDEMLEHVKPGDKKFMLLMEREDVLTKMSYVLDDLHEFTLLED